MNNATVKTARPNPGTAHPYPSLDQETRSQVDTACAAFHLNRRPRTLRGWATGELPGPIQPASRINGRLGWAVEDLRRLVGGAA